MSIRFKVVGVSILTIALFIGLDFLVQQAVIQPSFHELEREQALRDLNRCLQTIEREIHHLNTVCWDYAAWDDTYEYVVAPAPTYEETNLIPATFLDNGLNVLFILNLSGRVVWGAVYDLAAEKPISLPDFPVESWGAEHPLLVHKGPQDSIAGLLMTSKGPMLIASRPIVTGESKGPIHGTFVMGRFLDEKFVRLLIEQTQVKMQLYPKAGSAKGIRDSVQVVKTPPAAAQIDDANPRLLRVSTTLTDVFGQAVLLLTAEVPRETTAKGEAAMQVDALGAMVAGMLILLLLLILLRNMLVDPLTALTRHVAQIGESGELSLIQPYTRTDEFGTLACAFNRMVDRLRRDSEARERADIALRESEERFQTLLASLDDVVWSATLDGTQMLYVNAAAERVFGVPLKELQKHSDISLPYVHPEHRALLTDQLCALRATGRCDAEYRIVRPDGETRWLHDRRIIIHDASGRGVRVGGVISDITDMRRMHERVVKSRHLAELGELGASVAHEIRNPLAGISGALQVIRDGFSADDTRRGVVREALEQVGRVELSVKQLLLYARPWEPKPQRLDLRQFAENAVRAALEREGWDGCQLDIVSGPPVQALFDPILMEQVMDNLTQNAVQAMPEGGVIELSVQQLASCVQIHLRDHGEGMAAENESRVFEPFFTTKSQGTGLGLPICRRIMEAHGGSIQLVHCPDGGVRAILELPTEG